MVSLDAVIGTMSFRPLFHWAAEQRAVLDLALKAHRCVPSMYIFRLLETSDSTSLHYLLNNLHNIEYFKLHSWRIVTSRRDCKRDWIVINYFRQQFPITARVKWDLFETENYHIWLQFLKHAFKYCLIECGRWKLDLLLWITFTFVSYSFNSQILALLRTIRMFNKKSFQLQIFP